MDKAVFPALTGIRAVAAAMVVFHHLVESENEIISAILRELNIGVSIFFVLSGFLITYRYYDNFTFKKEWWRRYLRNRFARIYPLFFLLTTASFVLSYFVTDTDIDSYLTQYFLNVSLLKGFLPEYAYTGIAQSWTLTVEESFYVLAPLIFFLYRRKINIYVQCLALLTIGLAIYIATSYITVSNQLMFVLIVTFFGRSFEFAAGIMLALLLTNKVRGATSEFYRIFNIPFLTYSSLFLFLLTFIVLTQLQTQEFKYSIQTLAGYIITVTIIPVVTASLFWGLINEKTLFSKALSTPLLQYLGKSSYALYLFHWGIFGYIINQIVNGNLILNFTVTYLISFALYSFIEEPANKFLRRWRISKNEYVRVHYHK